MRYSLFVLLAGLAVATPAGAQTWRSVTSSEEVENFIDTSRIVRNGSRVRYWHRSRFTSALLSSDGRRFNEFWALLDADCEAISYRLIQSINYMDHAQISTVDHPDSEWEAVTPGAPGEDLIRAACEAAPAAAPLT